MLKTMSKVLFLGLSIAALPIQAEEFNCEKEFKWVEQTFSKNDAGYQYAIDRNGQTTFDIHDRIIKERLHANLEPQACTELISDWLKFFRKGHWSISFQSNSLQNNSEGQKQPMFNITVDAFKDYLESEKLDLYEGIWVSGSYEIGIKKDNNTYVGFIIKSKNENWKDKQIKLTINQDGTVSYYMGDHSLRSFEQAELIGNNYLSMGFISFKRKDVLKPDPANIIRYMKALDADSPYFEVINGKTTYLRIPSFNGQYGKAIAELIETNRATITGRDNLIVDIRNNGGGSDSSYHSLISLLYTNPIRTVGVEFLSTKLNNQRMLDFIEKESYGFDEAGKKWAKESYDKLSNRLGEFVSLKDDSVDLTTYESVLEQPKNIAILINGNVGSTSEQFLLAAKQSKKVKLFGTTTAGVLDVSNMYFVKSPSENYQLGYSLSKSMRAPAMTIDDKGLSPDFYLDDSVKPYEWIDFVVETF